MFETIRLFDPSESLAVHALYLVPLLLVWLRYARLRRVGHRAAVAALETSLEAGLTEPASLHPVIDPSRCLGCATCVRACPEGEILGLVHGKARLVDPASCIGHGACKEACPQDAIELVLGTESRGVEVPVASADFQSSVQGIFVAGELGGMGLIRNAIEQGRQAIEAIERLRGRARSGLDIVIVGAGPAGFAESARWPTMR